MDKDWLDKERELVTTELQGKAENTGLPFVKFNGDPYQLDEDYFGEDRDTDNPAPGPFEEIKDGLMTIKVWNHTHEN